MEATMRSLWTGIMLCSEASSVSHINNPSVSLSMALSWRHCLTDVSILKIVVFITITFNPWKIIMVCQKIKLVKKDEMEYVTFMVGQCMKSVLSVSVWAGLRTMIRLLHLSWILAFPVYNIKTWRLVLGWGFRLSLDFFARGLHTRIAVARLPLRKLGFLVYLVCTCVRFYNNSSRHF